MSAVAAPPRAALRQPTSHTLRHLHRCAARRGREHLYRSSAHARASARPHTSASARAVMRWS